MSWNCSWSCLSSKSSLNDPDSRSSVHHPWVKSSSRLSLWKVLWRKPENSSSLVQDQSCGKSTSTTKYVPIHPSSKPRIVFYTKLLVVQFYPRSSLNGPWRNFKQNSRTSLNGTWRNSQTSSRSSLNGPWIDIYIKGLQNASPTCNKHMYTTRLEVGAFVDIEISVA